MLLPRRKDPRKNLGLSGCGTNKPALAGCKGGPPSCYYHAGKTHEAITWDSPARGGLGGLPLDPLLHRGPARADHRVATGKSSLEKDPLSFLGPAGRKEITPARTCYEYWAAVIFYIRFGGEFRLGQARGESAPA